MTKVRRALCAAVFILSIVSAQTGTFTNPLLPSGPDPFVVFHDGFYYYMNTTARNLTIRKTRRMSDLKNAEQKVVWTPPAEGPYSHDIWAPELHFINGKWYIYFAADAGTNQTHRLWVIENSSPEPLTGTWSAPRKLADSTDKWAIDGSVFENKGQLYLIWSGWEGDENGTQSIFLARLKNPWTVQDPRVRISTPQYPWEKVGDLPGGDPLHVDVNEGPEMLKHGDQLFLIYSASGCWTDYYALGEAIASADSNLLDPRSWKKVPHPVFSESPEARAYGTGHNGFFKSPDGKQDWIIYHANPEPHEGCGRFRSPRAQPFTWKADGTPDFGKPIPVDQPIPRPSGEGQ